MIFVVLYSPVIQLGRIPASKASTFGHQLQEYKLIHLLQTNTRATKQRAELLASYDTISSHLDTTFSALSTALARSSGHKSQLAQVHLAILVGPSVTTAKSKLILGIDGLETKIWGLRTAETQQRKFCEGGTSEDDGDASDDESGASEEIPDDSEDETDGSDEGCDSPEDSDDDQQEEDIENDTDDEDEDGDIFPSQAPSPPPSPPYISHAEEQKFLQKADRLLSRTLAAADADGKGISSELCLYSIHAFLCNVIDSLSSSHTYTHTHSCSQAF